MRELTNRIAVVTGGLSGIGKATVLELAKNGNTVIIFDIQDDKAPKVLDQTKNFEGNVYYRHCNLFDTQEINESFEFVEKEFGKLDLAFNNAGFGILGKPFGEVTEEEIDKLLAINVKSYMICMLNEIKLMKKNKFGRIVNTASGAGILASKDGALYSACKHAVVGLTKSVALDYARENITVNAIAPGTIETELISPMKKTNPEEFKAWSDANPVGRLGKPFEIARVVSFLFDEESEFINGTVIPVDSGYVAGK